MHILVRLVYPNKSLAYIGPKLTELYRILLYIRSWTTKFSVLTSLIKSEKINSHILKGIYMYKCSC